MNAADVDRVLAIYRAVAQDWPPSDEWQERTTRVLTAYARLDGQACTDALLDHLQRFPKGTGRGRSHEWLAGNVEESLALYDSRVLFDTLVQGRADVKAVADAAEWTAGRLGRARQDEYAERELRITCPNCA